MRTCALSDAGISVCLLGKYGLRNMGLQGDVPSQRCHRVRRFSAPLAAGQSRPPSHLEAVRDAASSELVRAPPTRRVVQQISLHKGHPVPKPPLGKAPVAAHPNTQQTSNGRHTLDWLLFVRYDHRFVYTAMLSHTTGNRLPQEPATNIQEDCALIHI